MFRSYFDISSNEDVVTVGGYVSSVDQWDRLEPDWNRILEEERVREHKGFRCLHMTDFGAGTRWFQGWDEQMRSALLARLIPLLRVRTHLAVSRSVSRVAFDEAASVLMRHFPRSTPKADTILSFAVMLAVHAVAAWCLER